tara:strand:+ start:2324 stop:3439 length:1116 start_codon:yes stop_codon:yes gene_type:complete
VKGQTTHQKKQVIFHIAIYKLSSIGDVTLSTACINLLQQLPSPPKITWIAKKSTLSFLKNFFPQINMIELTKEKTLTTTIEELKDVDFLVDLQGNLKSFFFRNFFWIRHKKNVYSFTRPRLDRNKIIIKSFFYGRSVVPIKRQSPQRQYELMNQTLFKALQFEFPECIAKLSTENATPFLPVRKSDCSSYKILSPLLSNNSNWIGIAPGASYSTKRAPVFIFTQIINQIEILLKKKKHTFKLVFLGNKLDRQLSELIIEKISEDIDCINLAGKLSLSQTSSAIKMCQCLLANDSALTHIAEAVDIPSITLFGPTSEYFGFAPFRKKSKAFSSQLGCRPCSKHGEKSCRYKDRLCFTNLPVLEISKYISDLV